MNTVMGSVSGEFLKISSEEERNRESLGWYLIHGLILEGLFKKAVFLVSTEESMKILANYGELRALQEIYSQKKLNKNV